MEHFAVDSRCTRFLLASSVPHISLHGAVRGLLCAAGGRANIYPLYVTDVSRWRAPLQRRSAGRLFQPTRCALVLETLPFQTSDPCGPGLHVLVTPLLQCCECKAVCRCVCRVWICCVCCERSHCTIVRQSHNSFCCYRRHCSLLSELWEKINPDTRACKPNVTGRPRPILLPRTPEVLLKLPWSHKAEWRQEG